MSKQQRYFIKRIQLLLTCNGFNLGFYHGQQFHSSQTERRKVLGGLDRSRGAGHNASSLRLLGASRVSSTLHWCFFRSIGWNCSLCAFWFWSGKSLRFPEFCISMSVFDRLHEQAQCSVPTAFFHPFSLSKVRKVVLWGDDTSIWFCNEALFRLRFHFVFIVSFLMV